MRTKKTFTVLAAILVACMFVGLTGAAEAKIVIRANLWGNPTAMGNNPSIRAAQLWAKEFEKRAKGKVEVKIFWDNKLGQTFEANVNGMQNGLIHFTGIPMTTMAEYTNAYIPMANLFLIPYPHAEVAYKVMDGKAGRMMKAKAIKDTQLHPLGYWAVGFRHLTTVKTPIHSLKDIQGLKIRVQPNPVHLAAFKALGVNPTPIPWPELFTALQQGVVDGAENPLDNIVMARLYEPQKYLALTGHAFELVCYLTGEKYFNSLPKDIQQAWEESMKVATDFQRKDLVRSDKEALAFLKDGRMTVTELSKKELDLFREKVKPSWKVSEDLVGKEYFDKVLQGVAEAEKEVLKKK